MVAWAGGFQGLRFLGSHFVDTTDLTAKFVVSCKFVARIANFEEILGFSVLSIILVKAGLKANHNVTSSPSLDENDFRLFKNSEGNHDSW